MYHVSYVEDCNSKMKSFLLKEEATRFVANFMLKNQFKTEDNWIGMIIKGELIYTDPTMHCDDTKIYEASNG